ncbi:AhpC/TSA family protein [Saccharothrix sp. AJ9571]|nr:AhpC/TSA family protein [Saccharothrix sp. AJ9571]
MAGRIEPGTVLAPREVDVVDGEPVAIPLAGRLVHLQFRRFAGCPVCNVHLRSVTRRHAELSAAGVLEVAVFHSPEEELRRHTADIPFAVVADPGKRLYREFGVEAGRRALLDPRAWLPVLRSIATGLLRRDRLPAPKQEHGRLGLPADFLIAGDGTVLAAKYGEHINDQWSVDEVLALARASTGIPRA